MPQEQELLRQPMFKTEMNFGPFDPEREGGYNRMNRVNLFGCEWESLIDNNTTAPATWDGGDIITPNTQDWKQVNGDYEAWLMNKDKPATTGSTGTYPYNGMGRVVLKKNMVNVGTEEDPEYVNTLTQDMFYKGEAGSRVPNTDTVFVIQYDFTLGENLTVPSNCVLEFDGGSISGDGTNKDTITGDFLIKAKEYQIFNNVNVDEEANNRHVNVKWFGAVGDNTHDDTDAIKLAVLGKNDIEVDFPNGTYKITDTIDVNKTGQSWVGHSAFGVRHHSVPQLPKDTIIHCDLPVAGDKTFIYAPQSIRNIAFVGHGYEQTGICIGKPLNSTFTGQVRLDNVSISGFSKGLHLESCCNVYITKCNICSCGIGVYSMQRKDNVGDNGYITTVHFIDTCIDDNADYAYYKDFYNSTEIGPANDYITFTNCTIERNGSRTGIEISCKTFDGVDTSVGNISFVNCYGESTNTFLDIKKGFVSFYKCMFQTHDIYVRGTQSSLTVIDSRMTSCTIHAFDMYCHTRLCNSFIGSTDFFTFSEDYVDSATVGCMTKTKTHTTKYLNLGINDEVSDAEVIGDIYSVVRQHYGSMANEDRFQGLAIPYVWAWGSGAAGKRDWFDAMGNRLKDRKVGTTAQRPTPADVTKSPLKKGFVYFDTTLNKPIWWTGDTSGGKSGWVDATGANMPNQA